MLRSATRPSILTPAQRRLYAVLLAFGFLMLATSGFLFLTHPAGEFLPALYQWVLLAHIAGGLLVLLPMGAFVYAHLRRALGMGRRGPTISGLSLAALALCLAASGLVILAEANSRQYRFVFLAHQVGALALPVVFLGHRLLSRNRPRARRVVGAFAVLALVVAAGVLGVEASRRASSPVPPVAEVPALGPAASPGPDPFVPYRPPTFVPAGARYHPSAASASEEVSAESLMTTCESCHPDVTAQWESSAHRFSSFNNPFYRVSVEDLREQKGFAASQWCAGCHDPALLFPGAMTGEVDAGSPEAQAGLTCLTCHAIDRIHNLTGNGNYEVRDGRESPYLFADSATPVGEYLTERLVKAKPDVHRRLMLKPFHRSAEFCATCHKVALEEPVNGYRFLRGQNEYDAWHDSGVSRNNPRTFYLPETARTCQDCHMPREAAPLGDVSARDGTVKSHRFLAANTALPHLRGDAGMLRRTEEFLAAGILRVDIFAVTRRDGTTESPLDRVRPRLAPGETVTFEVVVRNAGVGHTFPGGTNDSNEGFVDFRVTDEAGRTVFHSGAIGPDGRVDGDAHFYRAVFVDEKGQPAGRRNPQDFRTMVYASVIPPGSADLVRYEVRVPGDARALTVRAAVKWRKFNRPFTEYVFGRLRLPVPDLPITEVAADEERIDLSGGAEPERVPPADWMRLNDYGIALLLQGDTLRALRAFQAVADLVPDRVDGYRNVARTLLVEGRTDEARDWIERAEERAPGDGRNAFFWGRLFRAEGRYDLAEEAFRRCLEQFPEDRGALKEIGALRFLDGDFAGALAAYLGALRIDPEDVDAHFHRMKCYEGLGRESEAAEAAKAYLKYKEDDQARKRARDFLLSNEAINREVQKIHVHR